MKYVIIMTYNSKLVCFELMGPIMIALAPKPHNLEWSNLLPYNILACIPRASILLCFEFRNIHWHKQTYSQTETDRQSTRVGTNWELGSSKWGHGIISSINKGLNPPPTHFSTILLSTIPLTVRLRKGMANLSSESQIQIFLCTILRKLSMIMNKQCGE